MTGKEIPTQTALKELSGFQAQVKNPAHSRKTTEIKKYGQEK